MKKYWISFLNTMLFFILLVTGMSSAAAQMNPSEESGPEMATGFYAEGKIYVVIGVIAIVLTGIVLYLVRIDNKIKKMEKEMNK